MAKKMKKPKPKKAPVKKRVLRAKSYMMVIRVAVPAKDVKDMRIWSVWGLKDGTRAPAYQLQILNAYYDRPGQPNAMPGT